MSTKTLLNLLSVGVVIVRFSFKRYHAALADIQQLPDETPEEKTKRKNRKDSGQSLLEKTERVDICCLVSGFKKSGYRLTRAFWKKKISDEAKGGKFCMAEFVFEKAPKEGDSVGKKEWEAFRSFSVGAFWATKVYVNESGQIHIPLCARVPRFQKDGTPVTQWVGEKIVGEKAPPIKPDATIEIKKSRVYLHHH
jgi:hypothetical protein